MSQVRLEMVPRGPFDLENQASRFGGWPKLGDGIVMAFPVEGWNASAAVVMRQRGDTITGDVHGASRPSTRICARCSFTRRMRRPAHS